jgi:uncharacterized protein
MIVDADCHISSQRFDTLAITADDLVEQMDRAGVERALVWLKPPYNKNIAPENRAIYAATQRYGSRLLGFGWANPRLGHAACADEIRRCFEDYGLLGLKFNGAQDDYVIDDEQLALPLIELAARYNKPLAFHIGADFAEQTHPERLGRIAARFPELPLLMIHMGGAAFPALDRAAIEVAARHPNIAIIGSAIHERAILRTVEALGPDRVCFGSDMPFFLQHVRLAMYRALLRDLDPAAQAQVLGHNILRIVGLAAPNPEPRS